jgi:small-conductance mechanosensitive channel
MDQGSVVLERRQESANLCRALAFLVVVVAAGFLTSAAASAAAPGPDTANGQASSTPVAPESLSEREREELLARLSDEQVRDLILTVWARGQASNGAQSQNAMEGLAARAELFRSNFRATLEAIPQLPGAVALFFGSMIPEGSGALHLVVVALGLALVLGVGFLGRYLFQRGTAGLEARLSAERLEAESSKLRRLISLWMLHMLGIGVFALGTMLAFFLLHGGHPPVRLLAISYVGATVVLLALQSTSKFLFAPGKPGLRAVPLTDSDAIAVHRSVVCIGAFLAYAVATRSLLEHLGISAALNNLIALINGVIAAGLLLVFFWRYRNAFALVISGEAGGIAKTGLRSALARSWHVFYMAGIVLLLAVSTYADHSQEVFVASGTIGTLLVLLLLPFVLAAVQQCVATGVAETPEPVDSADAASDSEPTTERPSPLAPASSMQYASVMNRGAIMLVILVALWSIAGFWGIDFWSMSQTGIGSVIFGTVLEIAIALFLAYVFWEVAKIAMSPYMPKESGSSGPADEGGGTGASRITTLMPLLQKFVGITLVTMTIMVILSSLGVNIGPLIAGAGVIGLAIGFGAQALVKDVISGVFFLMDDAFRKGEYIDIGSVKGTVERISIRSLQMRHHNGPIHTVPYGEIQYVTNFSRDWAIMKFELRIPYEADINQVRKIIKKTGAALMEDEEFGPLLLDPLKSQGVNRMDDSALIIRCKFTTIPGQQFYVRREAFTRIQKDFEAAGIKFAPRRVVVESTAPEGTSQESKSAHAAVVAAGAASAEAPEPAK